MTAVCGLHKDRTKKGMSGYIARGGKTEFKILLPEVPAPLELTAAEELKTMFFKAAGIELETVRAVRGGGQYLSVGATELLKDSGEVLSGELLGRCGFRLFTKNGSVFMAGAYRHGTLYAVYEFLSRMFDFEVFSEKTIRLKKSAEVELKDFDVTEVPDFEFRSPSHAYIKYNETLKNRFRMTDLEDMIGGEGGPYHNSFNYLPPAKFAEAHPLWYSPKYKDPDYAQLCYTARGDAAEYETLVSTAAAAVKTVIAKDPEKAYIGFTHQDNFNWCDCPVCIEAAKNYGGANSGILVNFLNDVHARLDGWRGKLVFFAYHGTNKPPKGIKLKGVVPFFAETNGDYTVPLTEGNVNKPIANNLKGWKKISGEVLFWTYCTNFESYLTPYNSFAATVETYRFAKKQGAGLLFDEGQINTAASTAWEELKAYVFAKLAWNTDGGINAHTDAFFKQSYGAAAPLIRRIFEDWLALAKTQNANGYSGSRSIFTNPLKKEFWPRQTLENWLSLFEQAELLIQKTAEADEKANLLRNIALERVSVLYLLTELYEAEIGAGRTMSCRLQCAKDIGDCGITMFNEKKKISVLFEKQGIVQGGKNENDEKVR